MTPGPGDAAPLELLAPAGNFEKLETAIHYGADAVYLAGKQFSLRSFSDNFGLAELADAIQLAHGRGVKVYLACNIYPRNHELADLRAYLAQMAGLAIDGLIVADPGVFMAAKEILPRVPRHISTQANTTSTAAARFWQALGAHRINVARELSLKEIGELSTDVDLEIEAFIHGAMCISYSGRCLLSNYLAGRDSNRGECCQPCRWRYALVEEKRPGQHYPLMEDDHGSYVFNSRDLCMLDHLPAMVAAGIRSFKIEGRMKGVHYVATTVQVYRHALDRFQADPVHYQVDPHWRSELAKVGHRGYGTGFYLGAKQAQVPNYDNLQVPARRFVAKVLRPTSDGRVNVAVRNRIRRGDTVEHLPRRGHVQRGRVDEIWNAAGASVPVVQPGVEAWLGVNLPACRPHEILRRLDCDGGEHAAGGG
ncbi:MAG: U32 family peptidase [Desulfosarcinaceae bacterium]|nr:U32 family peptidase [Desulfosarcinaceae bacterium]